MLINHAEYEAMYEVEERMWWYKILHIKTLEAISSHFGQNKEITILDAGCGTGGMMKYLQSMAYKEIGGFDFNESAVELSKTRGLNVKKTDILKVSQDFAASNFDVIVCNDVLYQFEKSEIFKILKQFSQLLKPNGLIVTNNNAFKIFSGTHDIAVGSKNRFVLSDFEKIISDIPELKIKKSHYWSLFLSPLILTIRIIQRIKLKLGLVDLKSIKSDVDMPSEIINNLLFKLVKLENAILKKSIFGSSLHLEIKKS
ncbi:MAG: class I SAM-dependent methyltransferase [Spirosomataceae bacterium]|jgi:ubiquinone/menaquinone biosynthesis C-methylase UbiE